MPSRASHLRMPLRHTPHGAPEVFELLDAAVRWDIAARDNMREAITGVTAATVMKARTEFINLLDGIDPCALAGYLTLSRTEL